MTRRLKVFLPRWVRWMILPILLIVWGVITWSAFGTQSGREELGIVGWLGLTALLLLVGVMMMLMSSGRLPAYLIEIEDEDDPTRPRSK